MSIIKSKQMSYLKRNIIFVIIYSLIFGLVYYTFGYTAPFLLGAMIALSINPISTRLKKKFNINKGISAILLSFIGVSLVVLAIVYVTMTSIDNIFKFINSLTNNYEFFYEAVEELNMNVNIYIDKLENVPNIDINSLVDKYFKQAMDIVNQYLSQTGKVLTSIPYIAIFIITLFMSTYFIAKDIDNMENKFYNIFTEPTKTKIKNIKVELAKSVIGYIKAYSILMGITFVVTVICFRLLKIPYSVLLSSVAAILDLVPFLGIAAIYIPFIIYYWIISDKFVAIILVVVFLVLSVVREVLEPKLVSVNIGISPLSTLIAIFVGLKVNGIVGVIFFLGLVVMHKILKKVEII